MKKVKLTQQQENAIKGALSEKSYYENKPDILLQNHGHSKFIGEEFLLDLKPLNSLSTMELARALIVGYEVEPEFKVGDWVKANWRLEKPTIHKLKGIDRNTVEIDGEQNNTNPGISIISLATPEEIAEEKERRWWAKHGRDVWELREGDLLVDTHHLEVVKVRKVKDNRYVIGSFTSYENTEYIKKYFKIACFAENRLDVKTNE